MCGIAGAFSFEDGHEPWPDLAGLEAMAVALSHRGPDEFGLLRLKNVGLVHARLSILDLAAGQQPMRNREGTLWIVFNGEIYNYIELRSELIALGHEFRTNSDTEVIIHAYEAWGRDCFKRFNGQWAVAIWDRRLQELVLSRDHFGIAPLHICELGNRVIFASEVKAIFAFDKTIERSFDPLGLEQTFTFWTVVPPQGVFKGITELKPGCTRVYRNGGFMEEPFWQLAFPESAEDEFSGSFDDAVAALRLAMEEATRLRILRSDVPVGCYLSGGLDSSFVSALGRSALKDSFYTFSLTFADAEYDETAYQKEMVEMLGSRHAALNVHRSDIVNAFPEVIAHTERPILRTAPVPLFLLSRLVREKGIKVVLTGEGADEIFAGYDLFREAKVRRFWAKFPASTIRPKLLDRLYPYLQRSPSSQQAFARRFFGRNLDKWGAPGFSHDLRWMTTSSIKRFYSIQQRHAIEEQDVVKDFLGRLPDRFKSWSELAQDQYLEIVTLLSGYLLSSQGDRMLMANSVEGRFPYLDVNVVKLANSFPPRFKLRVLDEKHILKRCAAGMVPKGILERKKQPYRAPDALAFIGEGGCPEWLESVLSADSVRKAGVFEPKAVAHLWDKCRNYGGSQFSNTDNMSLVGILSTQLLYENFLSRPYPVNKKLAFKTYHDFCHVESTETPH